MLPAEPHRLHATCVALRDHPHEPASATPTIAAMSPRAIAFCSEPAHRIYEFCSEKTFNSACSWCLLHFFVMEVVKRPGSPISSTLQLSKRSRPEVGTLIVREGPKRTSSLLAPIMLLTGHEGSVLSFRFDPSGQNCASSSADKTVTL
jgi:hypothetical protein